MDGQLSEFFLSGLQKLEQRAKKCIELRGECVEEILSLFAVACFIPGRAKDLSAAPRRAVHIYTQTIHRPTQAEYTEQNILNNKNT